jgi:hypothetical protein
MVLLKVPIMLETVGNVALTIVATAWAYYLFKLLQDYCDWYNRRDEKPPVDDPDFD